MIYNYVYVCGILTGPNSATPKPPEHLIANRSTSSTSVHVTQSRYLTANRRQALLKIVFVLAAGMSLLTLGCHHTTREPSSRIFRVTEGEMIERLREDSQMRTIRQARPSFPTETASNLPNQDTRSCTARFEQVRVEEFPGQHGRVVVFNVKEKATPA
jgi:hypothetical protein